jgi:hypothetical protein
MQLHLHTLRLFYLLFMKVRFIFFIRIEGIFSHSNAKGYDLPVFLQTLSQPISRKLFFFINLPFPQQLQHFYLNYFISAIIPVSKLCLGKV